MPSATTALGPPLLLLGLVILIQALPIYDYEFGEEAFSIRACRIFLIDRIRYDDISRVRDASLADLAALPVRYVSRPLDKYIYLERRTGSVRRVVLTPPNRVEFIARLKSVGVTIG